MIIVKRRYFFLPTSIVAVVVIIVSWLLFAAPVIAKYNIHEAMALGGAIATTNNTSISSNPIYSEVDKTTSQKSVGVNGTTTSHATEVIFSGHGMAKDINYTDSGKALVTIRDNGKVINTKGHVAITASNGSGKASADFQEIGHAFGSNKGITITATGTAFFDANATGKLAFLDNAVALYKDQIYRDGTDKLVAWEWK